MKQLTIISPFYSNELNVEDYSIFIGSISKKFQAYPDLSFEFILVDDGSKDFTWSELVKLQKTHGNIVQLIKLTKNFGSTNAVFAALQYATGDCIAIISADLQDPPELLSEMYENWLKGYKIVIANRLSREDPLIDKILSNIFYYIVRRFALPNIPLGGFDLSLIDRRVGKLLLEMEEKNSFFPFMLLWLGYEYKAIPYTRKKRTKGRSSYSLSKKIKIAIDAFVSYSYFPVRLISVCGFILGLVAMLYSSVIIYLKLYNSEIVSGWSSLMIVILLTSAFQMIGMGIIGEYIWRNLESSRRRHNYVIEEKV